MKSYIKRITSVVLSLTIALGATSFTKFSNVNAQETPPATPQEPLVLNEENANLEINDLAGLKAFRDKVNSGTTYEGQTVNLNADIDMSTIDNWNAIGTNSKPFKGTFEGRNHKISNLKIDKGSLDHQGLFGYIDGATIQDLGLESTNVKGRMLVGSLVGYIYGTGAIKNSYATGSVTGGCFVGGLVGGNDNGIITKNYATGSVTGEYFVGGLVGGNDNGTITNSYATGTTIGTGNRIGGLVGNNSFGTIVNNYAIGKVTGKSNTGGLVGYKQSGTVTNSYYDKERTGQSDEGKGMPLTGAQMIGDNAKINMTGFDFDSTWITKNSVERKGYYPYLKQFGDISAPFIELK